MASNTGFKSPGRRANDLEHVGGGGLLLQRTRAAHLSSRAFSMAMTAWSANVDDQLDLFVGKWTHLLRVNIDDA